MAATTTSSPFNLQIRSPTGVITLRGGELSTEDSVAKLLQIIEQKTKIPPSRQQLLTSFPPKPLSLNPQDKLGSSGIKNGDQLTLKESGTQQGIKKGVSEGPYIPPSKTTGHFVRRKVPGDNSCLFHSLAYTLERSRSKGADLRELVAAIVLENPKVYTTAFLGMANHNYVAWIMNKDHWGGAIEVSILSQHYKVEIWAFDTQTKREDKYGEDKGYSRRAFIIYTGSHYDALALAAFGGAPEGEDQTLFNARDGSVLDKARSFVKEEHELWKASKK